MRQFFGPLIREASTLVSQQSTINNLQSTFACKLGQQGLTKAYA